MQKWKVLIKRMWFGLLMLIPLTAAYSNDGNHESENKNKVFATWLWNTSAIEMKTSREEIFSFLEKEQVTTVYLQISRKVKQESYQSFIAQASDRGVGVMALDGAPDWVSPEGDKNHRQFFDWLRAYQQSSAPAQRFQGIQFDVEPYLDQGWKEDYQNTVKRYQDLIGASYSKAKGMGLKFTVAVPFWFDNRTYIHSDGERNLAEWVIQNSDETIIMAYRDQAEQIYPLVEQEIEWANQHHKKVTLAVETGASKEGEKITFYEEGKAYMAEQLSLVDQKYAGKSSYNGLAIHHLKSWMEMKP